MQKARLFKKTPQESTKKSKRKYINLQHIGEFGLIKRIVKKLGPNSQLFGGIGDDVAVVKTSNKEWQLLTCDCQVEGVHFKKSWISAKNLGRRAALVNISDTAAVGGVPKYALVSLGLPKNTKLSFVDNLYDGLKEEFDKVGAKIVGGNITSSAKILVDVFLVGEVKAGLAVLRSGAKAGNLVCTTGFLGEAKAGLLQQKISIPPLRLKEGQLLASRKLASAMMDISDGLSSDLLKLCQASKVGVEIWKNKLPISKKLKKTAVDLKLDPYDLALQGGEDYELLFASSTEKIKKIKKLIKKETRTKISVIGKIKSLNFGRKIVDKSGNRVNLNPEGWDHMRRI